MTKQARDMGVIPLDEHIRNLEDALIEAEWHDYEEEVEQLRQRILSAKIAESYGERWHVPW